MPSPHDILLRYWGYHSFRPLQLDIIQSVLDGNDTLGLLPTGGGKSLTFQVPAMLLPNLTIVVTPLISLMKDQVDNLRRLGIPAAALFSGLSRREHKLAMDRAQLGRLKLLYVSPEKLQSKSFLESLYTLKISLIVVDEAHCISQWGYDFRPSYLRIASIRRFFPDAPVLALTASATPDVALDIGRQLLFNSGKKFSKSFSRSNLSYLVRHTDHKEGMLLKILKATAGSAIVYVRSRKRTRQIAELLRENGISADYYHAGLASEDKNDKQNAWKEDRVRVMVATNAFGMGIDKPDVRVVVHIDIPSSLEEYYQEAGRAGRDGRSAFAVLITAQSDKGLLTRRISESFPEKDYIRRVYELAGNFLDIPVGEGYNHIYEFNFDLFCERFSLRPAPTRSALNLLTAAGYFEFVDEVTTRSRVMIIMTKQELYSLRLDDVTERVFQLILRTYTGLFADYVFISEPLIARRTNLSDQQIYESLLRLSRLGAIHYVPRKTTPYIFYTTSRELPKHVHLTRAVYEDMRQRMKDRIDAMKQYAFATPDLGCRVNHMLRYFGEKPSAPCGSCDHCRAGKSTPAESAADHTLSESILYLASQPGGHSLDYIARQLTLRPEKVAGLVRPMLDEGLLSIDSQNNLTKL